MADRILSSRAVEAAGVIGVIVSLGFVGMEIRQNTTAVRAATIQAVSDQAMELTLTIAQDEDLALLVQRMAPGPGDDSLSLDGITPGESRRLRTLLIAGFRRMENVFLQVEAGILDASALQRRSLGFYQNPFARDLWGDVRSNYHPEFTTYWDDVIADE